MRSESRNHVKMIESRYAFRRQILAASKRTGVEADHLMREYARLEDEFREKLPPKKHHSKEMRYSDLKSGVSKLILERAIKNLELEQVAVIDPLTEIYNRKHFNDISSRIDKSNARRSSMDKHEKRSNATQHSLIVLDIDHFKKVNDTYGHPAGDAVLRQVAQIVSNNIRVTKGDVPTRYGGEEFAVIIHNKNGEAGSVAERIRKAIHNHRFILPSGNSVFLTVSIGVSGWLENTEETVHCADEALYHAKENGRNKSYMFTRNGTNNYTQIVISNRVKKT